MASKTISKSVIWQLVGKFALQGIGFITIPIFTRLLSPDDYGYTALYSSWSSILSLVIGMQTAGSIGNARINDKVNMNAYLSSIMSVSVISFTVFLIISICFRNPLAGLLSIRNDLVILLVVQSFFSYVISFVISKFDVYKQVEKSTILSLTQTVISIGLSLFFVILLKENKAIGKIYGQALPVIIFGFILLIIIYAKGKCAWNNEYIKFCLLFSFPLILHGIGHLVFTQSDRIMLDKMQNSEVLGIYSVSCTLVNVLVIIMGALNTSWIPFYYDYMKKNDNDSILIHTKQYNKLFIILTIGFILLSFDVFKLLAPPEYHTGIKVIPILALSTYFHFLYLFPVNNEFYYAKTQHIPIGTIGAAVVNIGINWLLIPKFGIIGAAIGTCIAHILLFIFHWIISKYIIKETFVYSIKLFIPGIIFVVFVGFLSYYLQPFWYVRWILAACLGIYMIRTIIKQKSIF